MVTAILACSRAWSLASMMVYISILCFSCMILVYSYRYASFSAIWFAIYLRFSRSSNSLALISCLNVSIIFFSSIFLNPSARGLPVALKAVRPAAFLASSSSTSLLSSESRIVWIIVGAAGACGVILVSSISSVAALDAATYSIACSLVAPPFIAISMALKSFSASASALLPSYFLPMAFYTFSWMISLSISSSLS